MRIALDTLTHPSHRWIAVAALVVLSTAMKLFYVGHLSYWTDEAYTVWFSRQSLHDLWFSIPKFESHPPAYYTLAKAWQGLFGDTESLWYRHLSIVLSLAPLPFLYGATARLAERLRVNTSLAILSLAVFYCFFPAVMWYSIEARPYILFLAAYSAAFYGTVRLLLQEGPGDARSWSIFALAAVVTNWSHNTGMLFTLVLGVALATHWALNLRFARTFLLRLMATVLAVTVGTSPLLIMIVSQLSNWESSTWLAEPSMSYLGATLYELFSIERIEQYLFRVLGDNAATRALDGLLSIVPILLALMGFIALLARKHIVLATLFFLAVLGVPLLCFVISVLGPNVFLPRIFTPALAPFFVLVALCIGLLKRQPLAFTVPAVFFALLFAVSLHRLHVGYKEPWQQIAQHMRSLINKDSAVLLMPNYLSLPLALYDDNLQIREQSTALPAAFPALNASDFYPAGTPSVPGIRPEDAEQVQLALGDAQQVLLLTRSEDTYDPQAITRSAIEKHFQLLERKVWGGVTLYHFKRR